jgi:hypothetical protein
MTPHGPSVGRANAFIPRVTGTCVAPTPPRLTVAQKHHMSNQERELPSGTDWRELIASLLLAAAMGMFTVYGLVYFMRAMM